MRRTLIVLLALLAALALSACDDDESGGNDTGGTDTVDDTEDTGDTVEDVADADVEEETGLTIAEQGPIEELNIEGLSAGVDIHLDGDGIPHLECATDEDCAAVLGYMHARDRFIQMDIRRRLVLGTLSEIVDAGDTVINIDADSRALFANRQGQGIGEVLVDTASARTMGLLEAYSAGVNAWMDDATNRRNGASLQQEYAFGLIKVDALEPWTPVHSMATVAALVESLTNAASSDISLGEVLTSGGDLEVIQDLYAPRPFSHSIHITDYGQDDDQLRLAAVAAQRRSPSIEALGVDRLPAISGLLEDAQRRLAAIHSIEGDIPDRGSNNWVLGPDLSASGDTLLANDPHLGLANPSVWYIAHMDAKTNGTGDFHAAGLTFAGLPWVIIGQNEDIAWGATNTSFDFSDVYIETLSDDGNGVVFNDADVPFTEVEHVFTSPDGTTTTRTALIVPHHGPVLSIDRDAGVALTLRWTGSDMSTDVNFLTELMSATSVEEGRTAALNVTTIGQNWVMIDRAGNFGWFPYNTVPKRPWASLENPPYAPLDGRGDFEWDGYIAYEDLPQTFNRPEGYLATANGDMTGAHLDGDPSNDGYDWLQSYTAIGFRHQRIAELIEAQNNHTPATMQDIIGDTYSIIGALMTPEMLAEFGTVTDANQSALVDALTAWQYTCPTGLSGEDPESAVDAANAAEARGCAAFHAVYGALRSVVFRDEIAANGWNRGVSDAPLLRMVLRPEELNNPTQYWDDVSTDGAVETFGDNLAIALADAAVMFESAIGTDPQGWLWGRVHNLTLRADLFSSLGIDFYDHGPIATPGGLYTVNVANPRSGQNLTHTSGASMRLLCEGLSAGVSCSIQLPGGQPHFREDDNYVGMLARWLKNEPTPLVMDIATVAADAATTSVSAVPAE